MTLELFSPPRKADPAPARLQIVTGDGALAERLTAALTRDRRFVAEVVTAGIHAHAASAERLAQPGITVLDVNLADPREVSALEFIAARSSGPVVVVGDDPGGGAARRLLHLRIADWLPRQASASDLLQACEKALIPRETQERAVSADVHTFYPVLGGVGATTLAVAAAFVLAGEGRKKRSVCLVDLDLQSGMLCDYLDLQPNVQVGEIAGAPERLDGHLLEVLLSRHPSGLALLAAPNSLTGFSSVNTNIIARLLDLAASRFDDLVIDMPRMWHPWSENVLRGANRFYLVTELSVPGLRQARRVADEIKTRYGIDLKGRVIVNRVGWLGAHGLRKNDAYQALGETLAGFVSDVGNLADDARNRGLAMSELKRSNKLTKDLKAILSVKAG